MEPVDTAIERGTFGAGELATVLRESLARYDGGHVSVVQRGAVRNVWFESERVRGITSSVEAERLGKWVVARGLVSPEAVEAAFGNKAPGERLGVALVHRGAIDAARLEKELQSVTTTLAARMLLKSGEFAVELGARLPDDAATVDLDLAALLLAAARRVSDAAQIERVVGGGSCWAATAGPSSRPPQVEFLPLEAFVLNQLSTPLTLEQLRRLVPGDPHAAARSLLCLIVVGLAAPCARPASRSPEAAPASVGTGGPSPPGDAQSAGRESSAPLPPANPEPGEVLAEIYGTQDRSRYLPLAKKRTPTQAEIEVAESEKREALAMLERGEDPRKPHRMLSSAVEVAPDATTLVKLADLELGNPLWHQRALDHLRQAVELAPQCTPAWLALANYWSLRAQPDRQRRCLAKILDYDRQNDEVRQALEYLAKTS
jgi:hypothetical protein